MNKDYDAKTITQCVQDVFSSPQGQLVLDWMDRLYVRYKANSLVGSNSPNLCALLAYKAGKADVVTELRNIFEHGLDEQDETHSQEGDDEWETM
jgi:hypothetical protein